MPDTSEDRLAVLAEIEQRVRWLAIAIIDHANRVRPNPSGLKVGGPPVLHAINYLPGELDEQYLTTLPAFGGLQSYPSRSKDPDPVDYSTGSVGIGATAPIWRALARRYVTTGGDAVPGRFVVHEPRWLGQQGGRLVPRGAQEMVRG